MKWHLEFIELQDCMVISIPEDISIIGFDMVPFADVMQVPLTTIGVPVIEMGKKLGEKSS